MEKIKTKYFKTGAISFGFFILFSVLFLCCQQERKLSAKQIVERSVEAHGGIENWKNIKQLSFDKTTTLFNEDGSVESKVEQFQLFKLQPKLFGKIEWENEGNDMSIIYEDDKIEKYINDALVINVEELQKAENSFFAAQYVVFQPFELLNDTVELSYSGIIDLEGKQAHEVRVKYQEGTETSNKWTYYFDIKTFEVIANKVELLDHSSWIENLTFDTSSKFKFNAHRKSYRLNEAGEKTYLRAEYYYEDFDVTYK